MIKIFSIFLNFIEASSTVSAEYNSTDNVCLATFLDLNTQKVIKRICPNISSFDGLTEYIIFKQTLSSTKSVDLVSLDLEEMPIVLAFYMSKIETLDL